MTQMPWLQKSSEDLHTVSAPVYVYPDASGANQKHECLTNGHSDLGVLRVQQSIAGRSNPPIRDRVASVQALLENGKGQVRLQICCQVRTNDRMFGAAELRQNATQVSLTKKLDTTT